MTTHYYPRDLAAALLAGWPAEAAPLPTLDLLTEFISVLYQASLLEEEGRPVECHAALVTAAQLEAQPVALTDFHFLRFVQPRTYSEQELRRLSPAVQPRGSLLAVGMVADELRIWGMLFAEHVWDMWGDGPRQTTAAAPNALLVQVVGPGSLVFYHGTRRLLTLQRGRIEGLGFLQFPRMWGEGRFVENHLIAGGLLGLAPLPPLQEELMVQLTLYMQRRALAGSRQSGHGALIVLVPTPRLPALLGTDKLLRAKYPIVAAGAGARYPLLAQAIVRRLLAVGEATWAGFQQSRDAEVLAFTTRIERFATYLTGMGSVDGALVLTQQLEIVGFGVEIQASQLPLDQVYRALNMEGTELQPVAVDHGGTRHRAAYRVCLAAPDCLAIVVSQDGGVQFVHHQEGKVVFWDQLSF
ncbi:hypothetical protein HHL22_04440 [Hymenobacter sp. RP-2-7]|uniref:Probable sensor domain-containing protein n=1 Tax=Hymenobacter polaris TaxID=2682546 RepID=A0A7Y0ABU6_9BACT|nr:DNA integrity scanning protein DisA nucleotide-binding domain protein [Hymenobacter polaris]NML64448.1 hypothetical protein [Hymenobacter polaris]